MGLGGEFLCLIWAIMHSYVAGLQLALCNGMLRMLKENNNLQKNDPNNLQENNDCDSFSTVKSVVVMILLQVPVARTWIRLRRFLPNSPQPKVADGSNGPCRPNYGLIDFFCAAGNSRFCLLQKLQADPRWPSWANFWGFLNGWQMGWTEQRNKSRNFKGRCENLHLLQTCVKDQGPKRTKKMDFWSGLAKWRVFAVFLASFVVLLLRLQTCFTMDEKQIWDRQIDATYDMIQISTLRFFSHPKSDLVCDFLDSVMSTATSIVEPKPSICHGVGLRKFRPTGPSAGGEMLIGEGSWCSLPAMVGLMTKGPAFGRHLSRKHGT